MHHRDNIKADLAEWKAHHEENEKSESINHNERNKIDGSYLLMLTVKNETHDKLADFRKPLDIKYCFISNR